MYCLSCGYQLEGLPASSVRCPECGRDFSPSDPTTYAQERPVRFFKTRNVQNWAVAFGCFIGGMAINLSAWDLSMRLHSIWPLLLAGGIVAPPGGMCCGQFGNAQIYSLLPSAIYIWYGHHILKESRIGHPWRGVLAVLGVHLLSVCAGAGVDAILFPE